jgi:hypothetical protein
MGGTVLVLVFRATLKLAKNKEKIKKAFRGVRFLEFHI